MPHPIDDETQAALDAIRKVALEAEPSQATIYELAAKAACDPRTARRILVEGVDAVKGRALQERAVVALREMRTRRRAAGK